MQYSITFTIVDFIQNHIQINYLQSIFIVKFTLREILYKTYSLVSSQEKHQSKQVRSNLKLFMYQHKSFKNKHILNLISNE